jgi:transcriptional regulator with XRE-family HTH domain
MFTRGVTVLTTGFQLAAARALIGMDQVELAERAGLSANTIRSMEKAASGPIAGRAANVQAVQRALEAAGIEFLNHGQPGVRLRKAP